MFQQVGAGKSLRTVFRRQISGGSSCRSEGIIELGSMRVGGSVLP